MAFWQTLKEATDDWSTARDWLQNLVKQDDGYVSATTATFFCLLTPFQMLKVTIFDPLRPSLPSDPSKIGEHGLIWICGGEANWEAQLETEVKGQVGTLLVTGRQYPAKYLWMIVLLT